MKTLTFGILFVLLLISINALDLPQCTANCSVAHCSQCNGTICSSCSLGYSFILNQCQTNNCTVANCTLCDAQGKCLLCNDPYSSFNSTLNQCLRNCPLQNCALCKPTSNKCEECSNGYALNQWNDRCTLSLISNCLVIYDFRQQQFMCLKCKAGFIPTADQSECIENTCSTIKDCTQCNNSVCSTCRVGYSINANGSVCNPNPCSTTNCLYCSNLGSCLRCLSNYTLSNNSCTASLCSLSNCLVCKLNSLFCDVCKSGYQINIWTNQCEQPKFTIANCQAFMMDSSNQVRCALCDLGLTPSADRFSCVLDCPIGCANCLGGNCSSCIQGYSIAVSNGSNSCAMNNCTLSGCILCAANQTCLKCDNYTVLTNSLCVTSCSLQRCSVCQVNSTECEVCNQGYAVYSWNRKCITSAISKCLNVYDFAQQQFMCSKCKAGFIPSIDQLACLPINCTIPNCNNCSLGVCQSCRDGYQLSINKLTCTFYSFSLSNCLLCDSYHECIRCSSNYTLSNGHCILAWCLLTNCSICKSGSIFCDQCSTGYELNIWSGLCVQSDLLIKGDQNLNTFYIGVFVSVGVVLFTVILIIGYCIYRERKMRELAVENVMNDGTEGNHQVNKEITFQEQFYQASQAVLDTAKNNIKPQFRQIAETNLNLNSSQLGAKQLDFPYKPSEIQTNNLQFQPQDRSAIKLQSESIQGFNPQSQFSSPIKQSNIQQQFQFIQ